MEMYSQISAVVLASGMSKRMGTAKQLLPFEGVPLLESIIRKLLLFPFKKVYAIIGHHSEEIMSQIDIHDPRFEWKLNLRFHQGQSAALQEAVKAVKNDCGMMVFLADQPLIHEETVTSLINQVESRLNHQESDFVLQPSYFGQKGHPVFFSHTLFPLFGILQEDEGGKRIISKAKHHYVIPVDDPGILFDVDTPGDYQLLLSKAAGRYKDNRGPLKL